MKFFSELGSCCRAPASVPETEVSSGLLTNVGCVSGLKSSNKRRSSGQWRLGLSMISEDGIASAAKRRRERVVGSEKKASQEGGSRGRVDRGARFAGLAMVTNLCRRVPMAESQSPRTRSPWPENGIVTPTELIGG